MTLVAGFALVEKSFARGSKPRKMSDEKLVHPQPHPLRALDGDYDYSATSLLDEHVVGLSHQSDLLR